MKTVVEGKSIVIKLLGKQRLKDVDYRLNKYTLLTECEDGMLLHNTITGHLVLLNTEEASILEELPTIRTDEMTFLIENNFLVPITYDEKSVVDNLRLLMKRLFTPQGINGYTIMTTTNCNARCFYCYQYNYSHINMSEEMAENLVDYMVEHKGEGPLRIQWFGGEPLVGLARIDQVSDRLKDRGIEFTSSMISNGYLFTESIVDRAVTDWKLKNIQITLDGTEEIYNKTKSYITSDKNPYNRVLRNINSLLEHGVHVGIRLNLDQHNGDDLIQLISNIAEQFKHKELLNVYAHVVYENEGYAPIARSEKESYELYKKQLQINNLIIEAGLSRLHHALPSLRYRSCMADNPCSVVVYPDGHLYKCEHTVVGDEYGHISSSDFNGTIKAKYMVPSGMQRCNCCPLYPSCYILKECDGLKDRNPSVCRFDVESKSSGLVFQYHRYLKNEFSHNPDEDWKEKTQNLQYC